MYYNNILEAIGNTPLIKLSRISERGAADIYVKYEAVNIGGSIKTRTAYNMIREAERAGIVNAQSVIVEATSGNQGIGLALIGAVRGYRTIIIMPDSVSAERRLLMRQYGAEVIEIHDAGNIGECMERCVDKANALAAEDKNVFIPSQFSNPNNPLVHKNITAREILADLPCKPDGFCSGVGTGGTLSGIGEALRESNPDILVWALEPENAAILAGGNIGTHLQMGIGDGFVPENLNTEIYSHVHIVGDDEALEMSRRLAREEGILCGISSGSNVAAALAMARVLGSGKCVVTVLPDTAERYFSTPLFD